MNLIPSIKYEVVGINCRLSILTVLLALIMLANVALASIEMQAEFSKLRKAALKNSSAFKPVQPVQYNLVSDEEPAIKVDGSPQLKDESMVQAIKSEEETGLKTVAGRIWSWIRTKPVELIKQAAKSIAIAARDIARWIFRNVRSISKRIYSGIRVGSAQAKKMSIAEMLRMATISCWEQLKSATILSRLAQLF